MTDMKTSKKGIELIKKFEGMRLAAYYCPAHKLTIGYGHTGKDVHDGMKITAEEAELLLKKDCERFEKGVNEMVHVSLEQHQFDALVSFTYNLGLGNLKASTLLKKINIGDNAGALTEFPKWNKANGRVLEGLVRRREAEQELFYRG